MEIRVRICVAFSDASEGSSVQTVSSLPSVNKMMIFLMIG